MKTLSLLIFTKDGTEEAIKIVRNLYSVVDDVFIVDSSTKEKSKVLYDEKKRYKLSKMRIFYTPPLGMVDPVRTFGIKNCRGEWVLYLDHDEEINDEFKADLRKIIDEAKDEGLTCNRVEYVKGGKLRAANDTQMRLFKRNKTYYTGASHEIPIVEGKIGDLPSKYYIIHNHPDYYTSDRPLSPAEWEAFTKRYVPFEMYTLRFTYRSFLALIKRKRKTKLFDYYFKLKSAIFGIRLDDELSRFDYQLLIILQIAAHLSNAFTWRKLFAFSETRKIWVTQNIKLDMFFDVPEGERKLQLDICKEIDAAGGLIKYLHFDDNKVVAAVTKKYKNSEVNGIALLEKLLKDRYYSTKPPNRRDNKHYW